MATHDPPCGNWSWPFGSAIDRRLRLRLLTGSVLGAGAIAVTLWLPSPWFTAVLWLIASLGVWEWGRLLNRSTPNRIADFIVWLLLCGLLVCNVHWFIYLLVLQWIFLMPWQFFRAFERHSSVELSWFLSGLIALGLAWVALSELHRQFSPAHALFLILLIAAADTVAFFVGRIYGHHRLVPRLSPGKTWEGVGGALFIALWVGAIGAQGLGIHHWGVFIGLCGVTVGVSIVGDVYESLLKRRANAKDSSFLLPGHGGVLDRIDSLIAASPWFYLAFSLGIVT